MIPFLSAGLILIALVTSLMLALPTLARPTLPFGVRVGIQRVDDPVIVAARRFYARLTVLVAALAAVVLVLVLLVTGSAGAIGIATTVVIVVDLLLFYRAHRMVRAAKLAGRWATERRQVVTVDTTFRTDPVRVPWLWGLPALSGSCSPRASAGHATADCPPRCRHFLGTTQPPRSVYPQPC
ncbi:hypothetical protein AB0K12_39720 [Nonomuraea sp. NPDC049419]|uniref:hypothetical protein n=1 Tax=Nonomuraea sp. NPDC049419 TaxID=3155772 RepID=UPI003421CB97